MKEQPGCRYVSKNVYVDIDTGEVLRSSDIKERYIIIQTTKQTIYNELKTRATIIYTRRCLKQPQQRIPFS